jgi:hypothetical protein
MVSRGVARRAVYICVLPLVLCASNGLLTAQSLKITEPKDGTVVYTGQMVTVMVDASPTSAFQEIIIVGADPIGFSQTLTAPPYRFSIWIPRHTRPRWYTLTADGMVEPGREVGSDPVTIQVERSDSPLSLRAEPSVLDFEDVGELCPVAAVGKFVDADWVDLSGSSYVRYISDNPGVAAVTGDGLVTAAGPGTARITIQYNGKSTVVPVIVRAPPARK